MDSYFFSGFLNANQVALLTLKSLGGGGGGAESARDLYNCMQLLND